MYSELTPMLMSVKDVRLFCQELDDLDKSLFMSGADDWDTTMSTKVRQGVAEVLSAKLPQDLEAKRNELRMLKEEALSLPVVRLTLAIDPTETMVREISEKINKFTGEQMVIDIQRDSMILGGVQIIYKGKFADYSLGGKLEKVWEDNSARWMKMIYGETR